MNAAHTGLVTMSVKRASRDPLSQLGSVDMLRWAASRLQRFFGSSSSHWPQLTGQFTIIQPGLRVHSPFAASILQRRDRSWQLLFCTATGVEAGST